MGHPVGCTAARIIGTLINALEERSAKTGIAATLSWTGGATAIAIEKV